MKTIKKLASLALTAAMLLSVLMSSAMASPVDTIKYPVLYATQRLEISETLKLERDDTAIPSVVYAFEVTSDAVKMEGEGQNGAYGKPAFLNAAVSFGPGDPFLPVGNGDYSRQYTKTVTLDFSGVTFTEPGIYRWTITKTMTDNTTGDATSGRPSNNKRLTYVFVTVVDDPQDDGSLKLKDVGYIYTTTSGIPANRNFVLDGDYAKPAVGMNKIDSIEDMYPARYRNLTFGKKVTGNHGSKDKYFKFTLKISGLEAGMTYPVSGQDRNIVDTDASAYAAAEMMLANNRDNVMADENGDVKQTFYLQHGDYITVSGLPVGANYTVSEELEPGYKQTAGTDDVVKDTLKGFSTQALADRIAELGDENDSETANTLIGKKKAELKAVTDRIAALGEETDDASKSTDIGKKQKEIDDQQALIVSNYSSAEEAAKRAAINAQDAAIQAIHIDAIDNEIDTVEAAIAAKKAAIKTMIQNVHGDTDGTEYKNYKNALDAYEAALDSLYAAQNAVAAAQQGVYNGQSNVAEAQSEYDRAVADLAEADSALATATAAEAAARIVLTEAEDAKNNAESAKTNAQNERNAAWNAYVAAQGADQTAPDYEANLAAAQAALNEKEAALAAAEAALATAEARYNEAYTSHASAETAKVKAQSARDNAQTDKDTAEANLNDKKAALGADDSQGLRKNLADALEALGDNTKGAVKAANDAKAALQNAEAALADGDTRIQAELDELDVLYDDGDATTTDSLKDKNDAKLAALQDLAMKQRLKNEAETALGKFLTEKKAAEAKKDQLTAEKQQLIDELRQQKRFKDQLAKDLETLIAELKNLKEEKDLIDGNGTDPKTFSDPTSGTIKQASIYTGYTNTHDTIVPTGILLQIGAPIVGIVVSMGLFLVILISKRKKQNAA